MWWNHILIIQTTVICSQNMFQVIVWLLRSVTWTWCGMCWQSDKWSPHLGKMFQKSPEVYGLHRHHHLLKICCISYFHDIIIIPFGWTDAVTSPLRWGWFVSVLHRQTAFHHMFLSLCLPKTNRIVFFCCCLLVEATPDIIRSSWLN